MIKITLVLELLQLSSGLSDRDKECINTCLREKSEHDELLKSGKYRIINQIWNNCMNSSRWIGELDGQQPVIAPCHIICTGKTEWTIDEFNAHVYG